MTAGETNEKKSEPTEQKQSSAHANRHADNPPVVGLEVDHGEGQRGSRTRDVHVDGVALLDKQQPVICWSSIKNNGFFRLDLHLDLVAGGLVSLSVGPSLSSAVAPNHVLIELLGDVQIRHTDQVTAVLRAEAPHSKTSQAGADVCLVLSKTSASVSMTYTQTDHAQGQTSSQGVRLPVSAVLHLWARRST